MNRGYYFEARLRVRSATFVPVGLMSGDMTGYAAAESDEAALAALEPWLCGGAVWEVRLMTGRQWLPAMVIDNREPVENRRWIALSDWKRAGA